MPSTPILFLGDNPTLPTGLGRIGRDLATLVSSMPEFRVAYLGRGGTGSTQLPFTLYPFPVSDQWGEDWLGPVWMDFAPHERGIVFSTWDITRLTWLGMPTNLPECSAREIILSGRFKRWGYFPLDHYGPHGRLSTLSAHTLEGFDRVLTPTRWAAEVVRGSINHSDVDWFPHGLNLKVWTPGDRIEARREVVPQVCDGDLLVGVVATNQARKDWGLIAQVCEGLKARVNRAVRFWWHVDVMERAWSIPALISDFGLNGQVVVTGEGDDGWLAKMYRACDMTLHPGSEGFGYPIAESLACGTPAVHGNYAGGAELTRWKVEPVASRIDTIHNCVRPVYSPQDWIEKVGKVLSDPPRVEDCTALVQHLSWSRLWRGCWRKWWLRGIQ